MDEPRYAGILKRFRATRDRIENGPKRTRTEEASDTEENGPTDHQSETNQETGQETGVETSLETGTEPEELKPAMRSHNLPAVTADGLEALPQPELVRQKSQRVELQWPSLPTHVDQAAKASFKDLGVSESLCSRLDSLGYAEAFAVQTAVIPAVLKAQKQISPDPLKNILVNSFTGSGKTLAYSVPIVECLQTRKHAIPRALILVPTRPLLVQVLKVFEDLTKGTNLRTQALRADRPLTRERELLQSDPPDIIVATPGRLVDHLKALPTLLRSLSFLVVDEADRLLGQSFQEWAQVLSEACPPATAPLGSRAAWKRPPQRLIFSATLTRDPGKLRELQVGIPLAPEIFLVGGLTSEAVDTARDLVLPPNLLETVLRVSALQDKPLALVQELVTNHRTSNTIVFVRSNEAAARLARLIALVAKTVFNQDVTTARCSGELPVADRRRTLRAFANGDIGVLVCTDLIARGIDVPGIETVVNYDLPLGAREYVHRVGRTARAGAKGDAWTLTVSSTERKHYWEMQNSVTRTGKINVEMVNTEADDRYREALAELEKEVIGTSTHNS